MAPGSRDYTARDDAFCLQTCLRLGISDHRLLDRLPAELYLCPLCQRTCHPADLHFITCRRVGHTWKHNIIQRALLGCAAGTSVLGISITNHPAVAAYLPRQPDARQPEKDWKGDLFFDTPLNRRKLVDVTLAHPLSKQGLGKGVAAKAAARRKHTLYEREFEFPPEREIDLVPFAMETFGHLDAKATEFLAWLGHIRFPLRANDEGKATDVDGLFGLFLSSCYARLSAALATANEARLTSWFYKIGEQPFVTVAAGGAAEDSDDEDAGDEDEDVDMEEEE
jgi:hypothetical protein